VGATQRALRLQLKRCLFPEERLKRATGVTGMGALTGCKFQPSRGTFFSTIFTIIVIGVNMEQFENLKELVVSLTLGDRQKNKNKWMSKGFRKISRSRLVAYWESRLAKRDPKDLAMYAEILAGYKVALARRERMAVRMMEAKQAQQEALEKLKKEAHPPGASTMVRTAVIAAAKWAGAGFITASEKTIETRKATCAGCEHWDAGALKQTGRCRKCGCSTWAKIRMATESCPEGKWGAEA